MAAAMNQIGAEQFAEFFGAAHDGREPFSWQLRLLDSVIREQRWPDAIDAPTGSGKTAVIDVHVFCVAMMASGVAIRVPRRMALVVDRRAIVDSHVDYARSIRDRIVDAGPADNPVLIDMRAALQSLSSGEQPRGVVPDPVQVAVIRGGASVGSGWVDEPTVCSIICATPDMWGSRILLRGYGVARNARPRAAGLLAFDSVVVVDEAHLSRQLVATAKSISRLEAVAPERLGVPPLQVVAMTATQSSSGQAIIGVVESDIEGASDNANSTSADRLLARRLTVPKKVTCELLPNWPAAKSATKPVAKSISDHAVRLWSEYGSTVACVVNTVAMALAVCEDLKARKITDVGVEFQSREPKVVLLVGRMRPLDLQVLRTQHPGLFTVEGDRDVDFVVATQTIEVGVDMDFTAMVTELAPGVALAQRAGRVNRIGLRDAAEIVVVGPEGEAFLSKGAPPYSGDDLYAARTWIDRRMESPDGLSPWSLKADPPPAAQLRRGVLQRVELSESWDFSRTSDDGFAVADLDVWLADSFDQDLDVAVVVRQGLSDETSNIQMLRVTPPQPHELFPSPIGAMREYLATSDREEFWVFRAGELETVTRVNDAFRLRPGDIVVLDESAQAFRSGVFDPGPGASTAKDVFESGAPAPSPGHLDPRGRQVRIGLDMPLGKLEPALTERLLADITAINPEEDDVAFLDLARGYVIALHAKQSKNADPQRESGDHTNGEAACELLAAMTNEDSDSRLAEFLGPVNDDDRIDWIVLADTSRLTSDEDVRQTWSPKRRVALDSHSTAVQNRAIKIAETVGLSGELVSAMGSAGLFHDAGKRDRVFQLAIGNQSNGADKGYPPLAKSGMRSAKRMRSAWAEAGLGGWRHEQYSAAICDAEVDVSGVTRDLITRLVGTSHGRGRGDFMQVTDQLFAGRTELDAAHLTSAQKLFDHGGWEALVERTDRTYGVWACAYLEALLRAADCQVSGEGR